VPAVTVQGPGLFTEPAQLGAMGYCVGPGSALWQKIHMVAIAAEWLASRGRGRAALSSNGAPPGGSGGVVVVVPGLPVGGGDVVTTGGAVPVE